MPRSPSPPIRRATRTYGRRRDTPEHDFFDVANTSLESREDSHSSTSLTLDHDVPPSSDDFNASFSSVSANAQDGDGDSDVDDGTGGFQFPWRAKMKDIDQGKLDAVKDSGAHILPDELTGSKAAVPTRPASPVDQAMHDILSGTLPSLTSSSQSSPPAATVYGRRRLKPLPPSDPESETEVRPTTPPSPPPHPINTPQAHSSPTPPTSIETMQKQGKGKQRAADRDPVHSDEQLVLDSKPSKPRRNLSKAVDAKGRVKAPTKKDRLETQKATARIAADQQVSISRPPTGKYTISGLLERIGPPVTVPTTRPRTRSPTPLIPSTSDPIKDFSSSPDALRPTNLLDGADDDSDVEMPDFSVLDKAGRSAREEAENRERIRKLKQEIVQQQKQQPVVADDDDDDDLVIQDDEKSVARDEAQRRHGLSVRGVHPSRGRQKQLDLAGATARRTTVSFVVDDEEARHILETAGAPSFLAAKGKAASKEPKLDPNTLNRFLLQRDNKQKEKFIREKEDDWVRRGGKIKERPEERAALVRPREVLQGIMDRHRRATETRAEDNLTGSGSDEDEDYRPGDSVAQDGSEQSGDEADQNAPPTLPHGDADEQADDEGDDDNPFIVPRARRSLVTARHRAAAISSDDEDDGVPNGRVLVRDTPLVRPPHQLQPDVIEAVDGTLGRRRSSSLDDRTEDGTDKENDVLQSFDRGEDKENTAIAIQSLALSLRAGSGSSSLFGAELLASPAGRGTADGVRSPLREIPPDEDEDDPFTSPPPRRLSIPNAVVARDGSPMDLSLGGGGNLEPVFSLSNKGKERALSISPSPLADALPIGGGGGFSQFFTQEGEGDSFEKLKAAQREEDVSLTLEPGLQPALEVDQSLVKKADEIFEKEAEYAVQEQQETRSEPKPQMFVDANGFLTQTRPESWSPLRLMTPSQARRGLLLSSPANVFSTVRKPLEALPTQDFDDDGLPQPPIRSRLRKRNRSLTPELPVPSTSKPKNAFELLGRRAASPKAKKAVRSEFIEGEAEESDEEAAFGYGAKPKQDDEEEDGEDQDQDLEGLVDDAQMDATTLAEERVAEKHREQLEADDQANEKYHLDATKGVFRAKRRDRGVGIADSDSEEDEESRRIRAKAKRPRLQNDSIAALEKNPETRAFASEYTAHVDGDEDEFAALNRDEMELDEQPPEEEETREEVSAADLRAEMLQYAAQKQFAETFDPNNVNWAEAEDDSSDELENGIRVREVERRELGPPPLKDNGSRYKPQTAHGQSDSMRKEDQDRMSKWAKSEMSSRTAGVVGRSIGGSAAVTGHGKSKTGNGSFKASRSQASASAATSGKSNAKLAKAPSALSAVSSRRNKFA
ncbi:MRC1-like domain-containing protein [Trametes meyenii]|nr:MRC1-like domain-containing protein [Trametes meyenii]